MANNPLDLKEFKHYLNFLSDDTGRIQISEPVKFDGAEFVIEQDSKGYARDISYMSEEIDLEFYKGTWEQANAPYQLPNGVVVQQLGHAIEYLFEYNRTYGFQSQIEYILERNGIEFIIGELNFEGAKTDELTYFNCKVVQNTKRALSKRREDTKVNGFATKDLDRNEIAPIETIDMLLKAKPVIEISEWKSESYDYSNQFFGRQPAARFPIFRNLLKYGIADSLTSFSDVYDVPFGSAGNDFLQQSLSDTRFISAKEDLSNINIKLTDVNIQCSWLGILNIQKRLSIVYGTGFSFGNYEVIELFNSTDDIINIVNQDYEAFIPFVPRDGFISVFFSLFDPFTGASTTPTSSGGVTILSGADLEITLTSTAIDTVIKAVRYIDLAKYSLKAINGMDLIAPDFDEGGKFYDLFAFSGNLIRQRDDVPFYFDFKDRRENLALMNADIQVNEDDAFALRYKDFYANVDNGGFSTIPDTTFEMTYNKRYAVNLLEFAFKTYEKDRDESNTLDAVHTEAQFSINNTRVKNTKKIDVNDVFDPFSIESIRRQSFKETTALDGDDKIHGMDAVRLAPSDRGGFTASMKHNRINGQLKLLKDADLPSWGLLGFNIGSEFTIENTQNQGTYTVAEIENTIITLTPVSASLNFNGERLTTVSYPYDNVPYVNRTNQNFDLIENVLNPTNFGNLKYTIRRNLIDWEQYISTCADYIDENPKNTEFINNGLLTTQFDDGEIYTENADIDLDTIQDAILSPKIYTTDVIAEYDVVLSLIQKYQELVTVGGFVRVEGNNGEIKKLYPQKLGYTWSTKVLNIVGEERKESDFITITKEGDIIFINEVGYSQDQLREVIYEMNGEYFTIYDENKIKIINFTKYNKFIVQEETFDNPNELAQALIDL